MEQAKAFHARIKEKLLILFNKIFKNLFYHLHLGEKMLSKDKINELRELLEKTQNPLFFFDNIVMDYVHS
jgi:hypothetical protein